MTLPRDPRTEAAHRQAASIGCANPNSWARWNFDPNEQALKLRNGRDIRDQKRKRENIPSSTGLER